jgi:hypothetical protein
MGSTLENIISTIWGTYSRKEKLQHSHAERTLGLLMGWVETGSVGWIHCWVCNGWVQTGSSSKHVRLGFTENGLEWVRSFWVSTDFDHGFVVHPPQFSRHIHDLEYTPTFHHTSQQVLMRPYKRESMSTAPDVPIAVRVQPSLASTNERKWCSRSSHHTPPNKFQSSAEQSRAEKSRPAMEEPSVERLGQRLVPPSSPTLRGRHVVHRCCSEVPPTLRGRHVVHRCCSEVPAQECGVPRVPAPDPQRRPAPAPRQARTRPSSSSSSRYMDKLT